MQIETERLLMRHMQDTDAHEFFKTAGDPEVMRYWRGTDKNVKDCLNRIRRIECHWEKHGFGDWGVVEKGTGELIGFCGVHYIDFMPEVNIGYAFKKEKWRQGFAYESGTAAISYGFEMVGLDFITAVIEKPNIASRNLAQKMNLAFWKELSHDGRELVAYGMTRNEFSGQK